MTSSPGAPDWYPDPSGKPGLMYWDGRQWHTEIPAAAPPAEWPPPAPPRPRRRTGLMAALFAAVVVLFGIIGVTGYLLLKQSHRPSTPAAQAVPATQSTLAPQPAPTSSATPTSQNFTTPSGKICQVTAQRVTCQTCIPRQVITNAYTCTDPAPAVAVDTQGIVDKSPPDMASPPDTQRLSPGQTYHVSGWTIVVSGGWARFINDTTGHGMAIAAQNFDSY